MASISKWVDDLYNKTVGRWSDGKFLAALAIFTATFFLIYVWMFGGINLSPNAFKVDGVAISKERLKKYEDAYIQADLIAGNNDPKLGIQRAKDELTLEIILNKDAITFGKQVSDTEFDSYMASDYKETAGKDRYYAQMQSRYGWDQEVVRTTKGNVFLKQKLYNDLIKNYDLTGAIVRWDNLGYPSTRPDKNEYETKAKNRLETKILPLLKSGASREKIKKAADFNETLPLKARDKIMTDTSGLYITYNEFDGLDRETIFAEYPEGESNWEHIDALENVGDVTPVFRSSTGYFATWRLEKENTGRYKTWDDYLVQARESRVQSYISRAPKPMFGKFSQNNIIDKAEASDEGSCWTSHPINWDVRFEDWDTGVAVDNVALDIYRSAIDHCSDKTSPNPPYTMKATDIQRWNYNNVDTSGGRYRVTLNCQGPHWLFHITVPTGYSPLDYGDNSSNDANNEHFTIGSAGGGDDGNAGGGGAGSGDAGDRDETAAYAPNGYSSSINGTTKNMTIRIRPDNTITTVVKVNDVAVDKTLAVGGRIRSLSPGTTEQYIKCGNTGTDCSSGSNYGQVWQLDQIEASSVYIFQGWGGAGTCSGYGLGDTASNNKCSFGVDADETVAAYYTAKDLKPDVPTLSNSSPITGSSITFSGVFKNLASTIVRGGTTINGPSSGAFTGRFCVDNSSCLSSTTGRVGSDISVASIAAEGSISKTSSVWTATVGSHTVYVCADVTLAVAESNETNNCAQTNFTVTDPPPPLSCSPSSQSVSTNVNSQTMTASGGPSSTYSWYANGTNGSTSGGSPSTGSGSTFATQYSAAGTKSVVVISGAESATCSITVTDPPPPFQYSVSVSPSITIAKPPSGTSQGSNTASISLSSGSSQSVTLTQSGLPTGVTPSTIGSCPPPCSMTNTLTVDSSTPLGSTTITVSGNISDSSPANNSATYSLTIIAPTTLAINAAGPSGAIVVSGFTNTSIPCGSVYPGNTCGVTGYTMWSNSGFTTTTTAPETSGSLAFTSWAAGCDSTSDSNSNGTNDRCVKSVPSSADRIVTASYGSVATLQVNVSGPISPTITSSPNPTGSCGSSFNAPTSSPHCTSTSVDGIDTKLFAPENTGGYAFTGWSYTNLITGVPCGSDNECDVDVSPGSTQVATANYAASYRINVETKTTPGDGELDGVPMTVSPTTSNGVNYSGTADYSIISTSEIPNQSDGVCSGGVDLPKGVFFTAPPRFTSGGKTYKFVRWDEDANVNSDIPYKDNNDRKICAKADNPGDNVTITAVYKKLSSSFRE